MARTTKAATKVAEKENTVTQVAEKESTVTQEYELLEQYKDFTHIMVNGTLVPVHGGKVILGNPDMAKGLLK